MRKKKMNKKGFTMIELLATITLMGIIATMAVVSYTKYVNTTKKALYRDYEKSLEVAATNYFLNHTGLLPKINDERGTKVLAITLINEGYLENMKDPKNKSFNCNNNSYVIVTRKNNVDFNMDLKYKVCLVCSKYKSSSCGG